MTGATAIGVDPELIPTEAIQRREGNRNEFTNWPAGSQDSRRMRANSSKPGKRSLVVKEFTGAEKCEK